MSKAADSQTSLDPRIQRSRKALRDALLELLEIQPLGQISVAEISQQAGVGYATFYRHYESKEELLEDLARHEIRELLSVSVPIVTQQGSSLESTRALCSYIQKHRSLWKALLTGNAGGSVRAEFMRQALEWVPASFHSPREFPIEASTIFSSAGTLELLAWWLGKGQSLTIDEMAGILTRLIYIPRATT